ncbi:hypothetical protein K8T06_07860, partial [bacterium]|nr:hypothetical protein [bacterium]
HYQQFLIIRLTMKNSGNVILHIIGIFTVLVVSQLVTYSLITTAQQDKQLIDLYLWFIPISLFLQTLLLSLAFKPSDQKNVCLKANTVSVIFFELIINVVFLFTSPENYISITGPIMACLMLIRASILGFILTTSAQTQNLLKRTILTAVTVILILIPLSSWRLISRPMDGDEPYYLLISYSLLHDQDIDLENNYLQKDSLNFLDRTLNPQQFDDYSNGMLLSRHSPLMAMILIPGFVLAGKTGALLTMVILAGLLAAALTVLTTQLKLPSDLSASIILLTVLTGPTLFYSMSIFTELPAALLAVISVSLGLKITEKKSFPGILVVIIIISAIALKTRFAVLCIPPVIMATIFRAKTHRKLVRVFGLVLTLLISVGIANTLIYGSPLVRYFIYDLIDVTYLRIFRGITGLMWDPQYGLFPLNPLFFFAIPGIYIFLKREPFNRFIIWGASFIPYYLLVAAFAELSGGICPRGRFLVAWLPLLCIPLIYCVRSMRRNRSLSPFFSLTVFSLLITSILISNQSWQIIYPGSTDHIPAKLSLILNTDFMHIIPSFDRVDPTLLQIGFGFLALTLLAFLIPGIKLTGKISNNVSSSLVIALLLLVSGFSAGLGWQTSWMDVEDPTFQKSGQARNFWEETQSWERLTPSDSPYRAGIRLFPGDSITRILPLRPPSNNPSMHLALEIEARGSIPDSAIPVFQVKVGEQKLHLITLQSANFQRYFCPWPFGLVKNTPALTISNCVPSDDHSWVDIDRIRLVPWDSKWPVQPGN